MACVALLSILFGLWWRHRPLPTVGGGKAPNVFARFLVNRGYVEVAPGEEADFTRLDLDHPTGWLAVFAEEPQSLATYQAQEPIRVTPQRRTIVIQPLGPLSAEERQFIALMREYAQLFYGLPARVAPPMSLPAVEDQVRGAGAANRIGGRQYLAGSILQDVLRPNLPPDAVAYFGVTSVDLYAPGLNFVFGQGDFKQRVGVYSLCRYFPEFGGRTRRPGDSRLALRRACQVLNHEVGHVFGLRHCVFYRCSMNGSNSLGEADAAPLEPCPICHRKLLWNIGFDAPARFERLRAFYARNGLASEAQLVARRAQHWQQLPLNLRTP
jgi:archaemetzincin